MKRVLLVGTLIAGCTDASIGYIGSYGENAKVECYSGGQVVFSATSTGKVTEIKKASQNKLKR